MPSKAGLNVLNNVMVDAVLEQDRGRVPSDSPPTKAQIGYVPLSVSRDRLCRACGFFDDTAGMNHCNLLKDTVNRNGVCNFYVPGGQRPGTSKGNNIEPKDVIPGSGGIGNT